MTEHEMIVALRELVTKTFDPDANGQGYWETGNFDDTYSMGIETGESYMAQAVAKIIGLDLPDMTEVEV